MGWFILSGGVYAQDCLQSPDTYATTDAGTDDAPITVATCDLDGDGELDLVTANDGTDSISVLINDGQGGFGAAVQWPVTPAPELVAEPVDVACCDFDGNGSTDLVTANHTSDDVSVLLNDGFIDGVPQYLPPVTYPVGEAPWAVRCLPLDTDSNPEIITVGYTQDAVDVLVSDGEGGVSDVYSYSVPVGNSPRSMTFCDLDDDDDLDVATADFAGRSISLLRNDGDAGLVLVETVPLTVYPYAITCCDLDGVNGPDVITADLLDDSITVILNQTAFTFADPVSVGGVDGPHALACGDVDWEGTPDVVTANLSADNLAVFTNDGTGQLGAPVPIAAGVNPSSVIVAQFVGGPSPDVAAAFADGVLVYENLCGASGDADDDGDVDLRDLWAFQHCFEGAAADPGCSHLDTAPSGVIDLADLTVQVQLMSGPG